MKESLTTIRTMEVTTAEVVASPTARALRPHCMPRRQPAKPMSTPNTELFNSPSPTWLSWMDLRVCSRYSTSDRSSMVTPMSEPPRMPSTSA